jgi:ribosome-binding protein aMBF1 (putative translation factor)
VAKFPKKEKQAAKGKNILNNPEERKRFKTALATVTHYFQAADDAKEGASETIGDLSAEYGLDKKTIRKLAVTMYKHNYGSLQEENRHFEILYETVVEGRLRDDPVDQAIDDLAPDEDATDLDLEEAE